MRRVFSAVAVALCALLLVAGPAVAQQYPPEQPPDETGVLPGGEDQDGDDDDDDGGVGVGDQEAVPAQQSAAGDDTAAGEDTAVAGVSETQDGVLAYTGFELATGAVLALLAIVLGGALTVVARRRRTT